MTAIAGSRRRLGRFALALAALAAAIGIAEAASRALAPPWLGSRMREVAVARSLTDWGSDHEWPIERDGRGPFRFIPGSTFTVRDDEYVHDVRIDENGGRASGRAGGGRRPIVPVFGDSFTFGIGVRDEETWVSVVDRTAPVRLVNFGMPGSDLLEQIDQLDALDRRDPGLFKARVCLFVVFLGNDLTTIESAINRDEGSAQRRGSVLSDWLSAANAALDAHWILRRWYIVQWGRALTVRAVNATRSEPQVQGMLALMDRRARLDGFRRAFGEAVDRLVRASVRVRFTPSVIIIPDRFQVDESLRRNKGALYGVDSTWYDARQPNRIVTEAMTAAGIAFIDVSACLEGVPGQHYPRDGHLNAAGHETVAGCVAPFIRERSAAVLR